MARETQFIAIYRPELELVHIGKHIRLSRDTLKRIIALCLLVVIIAYLFAAFFLNIWPLEDYAEKKERRQSSGSPIIY